MSGSSLLLDSFPNWLLDLLWLLQVSLELLRAALGLIGPPGHPDGDARGGGPDSYGACRLPPRRCFFVQPIPHTPADPQGSADSGIHRNLGSQNSWDPRISGIPEFRNTRIPGPWNSGIPGILGFQTVAVHGGKIPFASTHFASS